MDARSAGGGGAGRSADAQGPARPARASAAPVVTADAGEVLVPPRRRLRVLTITAVVLLLLGTGAMLWHEYRQEMDGAAALERARARVVADDVQRTLDAALIAIRQVEAQLAARPAAAATEATAAAPAPARRIARMRAQLLAALPLPLGLHALDALGRHVDLEFAPSPPAGAAAAALPTPQFASGTQWQVGERVGPPERQVVPLVRIAAPNAVGVAAWSVELDHPALVRRLDGHRRGETGGAALLRVEPDGTTTLLARAGPQDAGGDERSRGALAQAIAREGDGILVAAGEFGAARRLLAYRRLPGEAAALVVVTDVTTAAIEADWWAQLPWVVGLALLLAGGMAWGERQLERSLRALGRSHDALRANESHYRTLADNLPDVVARLDAGGRHLYANAALEAATGIAPPAIIGRTNAELGMPAANVRQWMDCLQRVMTSGRAERLEFSYPGPQGLRHWESLAVPEPAAPAGLPTVLVISRDITERKAAELARERLNQRMVSLLEGMSDGFISLDRQWRYTYVNRRAGELFGREPASLIGKNIWSEFPEGAGQPVHRAYERAMNEGVVIRLEDFQPRWQTWFENRIHPTPDGISVFLSDVGDRRRATEALRRSEQLLREAQRIAHVGHWDWDLALDELSWSEETFRILEVDPARGASYDAYLEAVHPEDRDAADRAHRRSIDERISYAFTARLLRPDGRVAHVHEQGHTYDDPKGRPLRMVGTVQDITDRVQAEEALRASEARHRELFQSNPHPMYVYDLETLGFLAVNDAAVRQYGHTREQFLGLTMRDIRPPEDMAPLLRSVARSLESPDGLDQAGIWRHVTHDGQVLEVEISSHTLQFAGRPAKLVLAHDVTRRNQVERELRIGEERLRLALQAANQGLYDLDLRTGEAVVSPEYARMLGYEPETFHETNAAWRERLHPDDQADVARIYADYVAGRLAEYRVEFRQRLRDGNWKWILSLGRIVEHDAEGRPARMLGTHTDITPFKQAQAALAASEARYRQLFENSPLPMMVYERGSLQMLAVNAAFVAQYGYGRDEALALRLPELYLPEDRPTVAERAAQLVGLAYVGEWRHLRKNGSVVVIEARSHDIDFEGRRARIAALADITERRAAEDQVRRLAAELEQRVRERTAELERSEAQLRAIVDTAPVAISQEDWSGVLRLLRGLRAEGVADPETYFAEHPEVVKRCVDAVKVVRLNQRAAMIHEVKDLERDVPDLSAFFPDIADLPQFAEELVALWRGQRLFTAKRTLPSLGGRPLSLLITVALPVLDADDATTLVCMVDITEVDRLNAELERSLARLRHVNQELETFTYSVSHDLRAPLRGIDGYSRLLLTDHQQQLDDEGRLFLQRIRQATQHMGVLIDDLLAYSRLERREPSLAPLAVADAVRAVLQPFRAEIGSRGVQLLLEVPEGLRVQGDAQGVEIALRNLVDNALKFSRDTPAPRVRIDACAEGGKVCVRIQDNGPGFDMKFHERIFAIFQRLHRAEEYPGTGIGLAIVRKAMQRMGGRVWAESAPGQGATFHLELPEAA